jgi:formamidopyrimidine-DNA glycosylase
MPELPEVETVRRGLEPILVGNAFARVEQRRANLRFPLPKHFGERLSGRKIEALDRRAKYLLARLDDGEVLVMHLGMTGSFSIDRSHASRSTPPSLPSPTRGEGSVGQPQTPPSPLVGEDGRSKTGQEGGLSERQSEAFVPGAFTHPASPVPKHEHIVFHFADGAAVRYSDARRFGLMDLIPSATLDSHALFKGLGVEPLSSAFSSAWLASRLRGKATSIKAALVDQRLIAGLGNIYACEALFRAGISPLKPAGTLATKSGKPTPRTEALVAAVKAVLEAAIKAGGSSLRDYRRADGTLGDFQHRFKVYGRGGKPCQRKGCRGIVRRIVQSGRSTFYCPTCQR